MDIYHGFITALIAASPISELRGAIPIGLSVYHLSIGEVLFWAILGNIFPVVFLLWLLQPLAEFLSHHFYFFNRFFAWLFSWTQRRHSKKFAKWRDLALMILVAIPLPLTGAWTGSVAAFVFGVPRRHALPLIFSGILIAGIIVSLVTLGFLRL